MHACLTWQIDTYLHPVLPLARAWALHVFVECFPSPGFTSTTTDAHRYLGELCIRKTAVRKCVISLYKRGFIPPMPESCISGVFTPWHPSRWCLMCDLCVAVSTCSARMGCQHEPFGNGGTDHIQRGRGGCKGCGEHRFFACCCRNVTRILTGDEWGKRVSISAVLTFTFFLPGSLQELLLISLPHVWSYMSRVASNQAFDTEFRKAWQQGTFKLQASFAWFLNESSIVVAI